MAHLTRLALNNVRLYPQRIFVGKSYKGVKRCTVPNQSMTLAEIVQRYVRREPLPLLKEGMYEDRFGDLEKIERLDISEKYELARKARANVDRIRKKQKADDIEAEKKVKAAAVAVPVSGAGADVAPAVV